MGGVQCPPGDTAAGLEEGSRAPKTSRQCGKHAGEAGGCQRRLLLALLRQLRVSGSRCHIHPGELTSQGFASGGQRGAFPAPLTAQRHLKAPVHPSSGSHRKSSCCKHLNTDTHSLLINHRPAPRTEQHILHVQCWGWRAVSPGNTQLLSGEETAAFSP